MTYGITIYDQIGGIVDSTDQLSVCVDSRVVSKTVGGSYSLPVNATYLVVRPVIEWEVAHTAQIVGGNTVNYTPATYVPGDTLIQAFI